ncbi:MAG: GWxTD domain-containing protein, partial [Fidelibacterota bacterium]
MKKMLVPILLALLTWSSVSLSQENFPIFRNLGIPNFYYDVAQFKSDVPKKTKFEVFIKIPYDDLQFIKEDYGYKAQYEVSIIIFDESGEQADGKIWKEEIFVDDFDLTNSREHFDISKVTFNLNPGIYKLSLGVMDMDTRKTGFRKKVVKIKDLSNSKLALSDILLIDKIQENPLGKRDLIPNVMNSFVDTESNFILYFEIYNRSDSVRINYIVKDIKGEVAEKRSYPRALKGPKTEELIYLQGKNLQFSKYIIYINVEDSEGNRDQIEKVFQIRWLGMSSLIINLDEAVEQLQYIIRDAELNEMKRASAKKKKELFIKFWKKKDPTPETEVNELMNEYYRRVNYANENFSSFKEGWRTDMGMIYILFGPPNDIERHPFDIDSKPYEIWYYYDINRQFVFLDSSGFGEYRLVSPLYDFSRKD